MTSCILYCHKQQHNFIVKVFFAQERATYMFVAVAAVFPMLLMLFLSGFGVLEEGRKEPRKGEEEEEEEAAACNRYCG